MAWREGSTFERRGGGAVEVDLVRVGTFGEEKGGFITVGDCLFVSELGGG